MLSETRRRTVLCAMQVDCWLPRAALPFAAAPRAHMLESSPRNPVNKPQAVAAAAPTIRAKSADKVRAQLAAPAALAKAARQRPAAKPERLAVSRFSLQLLRSGDCLLLMDCPYGEFLQGREPSYLLLLDLLRAAQLPPAPKPLGEPVNWPLLANHKVAQDDAAARDYVQGFIRTQIDAQPAACLWLLGADALRFAAGTATAVFHELYIEALCNAWVLPTLDELRGRPMLKRELWQSMQRLVKRWKADD